MPADSFPETRKRLSRALGDQLPAGDELVCDFDDATGDIRLVLLRGGEIKYVEGIVTWAPLQVMAAWTTLRSKAWASAAPSRETTQ